MNLGVSEVTSVAGATRIHSVGRSSLMGVLLLKEQLI